MTGAMSGLESRVLVDALSRLADGEFHSGEELGLLLGVSRAGIWKALQKLNQFGVALESVKGKGYRIKGGLDLLCADDIYSYITTTESLDIKLFTSLPSTNAYLMQQNHPDRLVCLAEHQSAGRGRRGRSWVSPFAQNIYLSMGWGFEGGIAALEGLSLAVGLAIVRTLQGFGVTNLKLKWPNDVLYQDKKLAGVLVEMSGDPAGYCRVVIGIGLNVSMTGQGGQAIDQPWFCVRDILQEQGAPLVSRSRLAAALLDNLVSILSSFDAHGFSLYRDEWLLSAAYLNQSINVQLGNGHQSGYMRGVNNSGALLIETSDGEQLLYGGEVSLRAAYDS